MAQKFRGVRGSFYWTHPAKDCHHCNQKGNLARNCPVLNPPRGKKRKADDSNAEGKSFIKLPGSTVNYPNGLGFCFLLEVVVKFLNVHAFNAADLIMKLKPAQSQIRRRPKRLKGKRSSSNALSANRKPITPSTATR